MKIFYIPYALLPLMITFNVVKAQTFEKKEFKQANTLIVYVGDSSMERAKERFVDFIDTTGFRVYKEEIQKDTPKNNNNKGKSLQINQTDNKPKLMSNHYISGDTIYTALASLFDVMMGQYSARLKFYTEKDSTGKLYLAVTGFVSSNAFGVNFFDLQIQKGGKGSNWAQRELFKKLNDYLLQYDDVFEIMYAKE
ncbi:MAG: hypothetical protein KKF98_01670 [Bacteroidetes bacterium]|nr:hypothetical protein [Bacteroidota bacterium]